MTDRAMRVPAAAGTLAAIERLSAAFDTRDVHDVKS